MYRVRAVYVLQNCVGCVREGLEARDEDCGEFQEAFGTGVVLVVAAQDLLGDDFAEESAGEVYGLVVGVVGLLADELHAVYEEAVDKREILHAVVFVDEGADDGYVHAGGSELVE